MLGLVGGNWNVLKSHKVETWLKAQLYPNCACPSPGELPASVTASLPNMSQLAQTTLVVGAGSVANPHSTRLHKMTGFRAKMSRSTTDKLKNALVKWIIVDPQPFAGLKDQGLEFKFHHNILWSCYTLCEHSGKKKLTGFCYLSLFLCLVIDLVMYQDPF